MILCQGGEINKSILSDAGYNVYDKSIFFSSEIAILAAFVITSEPAISSIAADKQIIWN